jgi:hypothetical protein
MPAPRLRSGLRSRRAGIRKPSHSSPSPSGTAKGRHNRPFDLHDSRDRFPWISWTFVAAKQETLDIAAGLKAP